MYSPVPNGDQLIEGNESEGGSVSIDYADDSEDSSDDSEESDAVESPPWTERRSKQAQDPVAGQGKAVVSSARNSKHTWTATPDPIEKSAKQPKVAPVKPRKALPRIKVTVPIASKWVLFFFPFLFASELCAIADQVETVC
jgi:hypothetical protein